MIFFLILLLNIELPNIHASQVSNQSTEETNNENQWRKYFSKFRQPKGQEGDLEAVIETEIEKIDDEMNRLQNESIQHTHNSTADKSMRENRKALIKNQLKQANRILLQIRDYVFYTENICLKSINRTSSTPLSKSSTTQINHGRHYNRWMLFFDQCNHEDFITISTKSDKSLDRIIFSEQIDVLFSLTNGIKNDGIEDQWYKKTIYSKQSLLDSLKKHTTLDNNFLNFFNIMYDIVVAFYERWEREIDA